MKDTEHAWAAGFFDGEGSIYLKPFKNPASRGGIRHQPKLVVGQCVKEPLELLQTWYGGGLRLRRNTNNPNHRPCWEWSLPGGLRVGETLNAWLPYLTVKKAEALLILEFIGKMKKNGKPLTSSEFAERERIAEEITLLKKAGRGIRIDYQAARPPGRPASKHS